MNEWIVWLWKFLLSCDFMDWNAVNIRLYIWHSLQSVKSQIYGKKKTIASFHTVFR